MVKAYIPTSLMPLWNTWRLEAIFSSYKLLKKGELSRREERLLRNRTKEVIRELAREIITSRHEPMTAKEVTQELLNIRNEVLKSAGYLDAIKKVIGEEITPQQFIRNLLCICQNGKERMEKTISRLLSWDEGLFKTDDGLFWSYSWSPEEIFQKCAQLASKYRVKDKEMKEFYKKEAISLLQSGLVNYPDKDELIQTLRRL